MTENKACKYSPLKEKKQNKTRQVFPCVSVTSLTDTCRRKNNHHHLIQTRPNAATWDCVQFISETENVPISTSALQKHLAFGKFK